MFSGMSVWSWASQQEKRRAKENRGGPNVAGACLGCKQGPLCCLPGRVTVSRLAPRGRVNGLGS